MSKVNIRMKNKMLSKVHLDSGGQMVISAVKAASDAASKGISAQPAGPLTEVENKGNPGVPPSQLTAKTSEPGTGAPAERVAPDALPEKDVQPALRELTDAPSQQTPLAKGSPVEKVDPVAGTPDLAPHQKVPVATADKVLKNESAADATVQKVESDASDSVEGKQEVAY